MPKSESPIFIVGMQRSGTTLMRAILSSHPDIAIAPETHYCNHFVQEVEGGSALDDEAFRSFWRIFSQSTRFKDLGIDPEPVEQSVYESGDLSFGNTFGLVLREYARQQGRKRWGEKTPHHYMHIQQLLRWFPTAKILVMVRDPRAVCSSLLLVPWRKGGSRGMRSLEPSNLRRARRLCLDAAQWQRHVDDLRSRWSGDERVKIVTYEYLVHEPDTAVRDVCKFVEAPFVDSMLTARGWSTVAVRDYKSYSSEEDTWRRNHLASTIAPITSVSVEKWKHSLSSCEVVCIEKTCGDAMQWMGYDRMCEKNLMGDSLREYIYRLWGWTYRTLHSQPYEGKSIGGYD